MADIAIPDWVDRRTAEWCAAICDHVAARATADHIARDLVRGAETCAKHIRAAVCVGRPMLPTLIDGRSDV